MAKLLKQDKVDIYNLWKNYDIGPAELSRRYNIDVHNISYLIALIETHGLTILDRPRIEHTVEFKAMAIKRILIDHESIRHTALELGLKSAGILANWLRQYRENGYNVINHKKGRQRHDQKTGQNQAARKRKQVLTPEEFETYCREQIYKKIKCLSRSGKQKPQSKKIAKAVNELRHEFKISATFILMVINTNPDLPNLSRSNYYYCLKHQNSDQNKTLMTKIRSIYETHKHRYGYRRITLELKRQRIIVNHKRI